MQGKVVYELCNLNCCCFLCILHSSLFFIHYFFYFWVMYQYFLLNSSWYIEKILGYAKNSDVTAMLMFMCLCYFAYEIFIYVVINY